MNSDDSSSEITSGVLFWLYQFQSLIAGVLALLAAFATIGFLHYQQKQLQKRDHNAIRANLPLALSKLMDYTETCLVPLFDMLERVKSGKKVKAGFTAPELPQFSLEILTELVRCSSPADSQKLQSVLSFIQIHNSRLHSLALQLNRQEEEGWLIHEGNIRSQILDGFVQRKVIGHLFSFSRWQVDSIPTFDKEKFSPNFGYQWLDKIDDETQTYLSKNLAKEIDRQFNKYGT